MKRFFAAAAFLVISFLLNVAPAAEPDIPHGEVKQYSFSSSTIFPGTVRDYWVYVPKQYDPAKPACVYVNQDGIQFDAPAVFDKLIAAKEMPVTVGIFVMHGRVKATSGEALDRFNRSYEYDGLGDDYARFLLEELLPHIEKEHKLNLSHSGNDRAIGGTSSGAVCAFTAAWERPDAFTRVFSGIGTYVGLRGANAYPTLIRKYEPKPIRIFLQDGSADQNIYAGDWWMANQEMERTLTFAGYEVNHAWGDGGHNNKHATEVFPDALRWLWKDWPTPVKVGAGSPQLKDILLPGEEWKLLGDDFGPQKGLGGPSALAANAKGEVFFSDNSVNKQYKMGLDGKITSFVADAKPSYSQAFGPDGRRLAGVSKSGTSKIVAYDNDANSTTVTDAFGSIMALSVRHDGIAYFTTFIPFQDSFYVSVHGVNAKGEKLAVESPIRRASGIALSPDQSLLYVSESVTHWVYSYQIAVDGSLTHRQKFFHLHVPDNCDIADTAGAAGLSVDRDGRLYVATLMGIQVCDQAGRVNCIIPTPAGKPSQLTFGGKDFDTLFVSCQERLYSRRVKTIGARAFEPPFKPQPPKL